MGQLRTVHGAGHWYLVARHGDRVLRVRPRLLLGETAAGELSFDASCAQLELDVDDDGSILLNAVGGHELEWAGGVRCHRERLARNRGAEIRLFHNVLLLDTDFVEEPESGLPNEEVKEAQIRRFPDLLLGNPVDRIVAEPPAASLEPPPAEPPTSRARTATPQRAAPAKLRQAPGRSAQATDHYGLTSSAAGIKARSNSRAGRACCDRPGGALQRTAKDRRARYVGNRCNRAGTAGPIGSVALDDCH